MSVEPLVMLHTGVVGGKELLELVKKSKTVFVWIDSLRLYLRITKAEIRYRVEKDDVKMLGRYTHNSRSLFLEGTLKSGDL